MGLLSFVKEAGRRLGVFGERKEAEEAIAEVGTSELSGHPAVAADIRAAILSYVEIADLVVTFDGETAQLSGTASSRADAERAVLVAGNTEGVAMVDDGGLIVETPEPPSVHHTVVDGDTLSELADAYYGVLRLYDVIFEANRPMLADPDEIYPGQVLRIPPVKPPTHVVAKGETLGTIADHWYGSPKHYTAIFEANRSILPSADEIEVGQSLTIPLREPKVQPLA